MSADIMRVLCLVLLVLVVHTDANNNKHSSLARNVSKSQLFRRLITDNIDSIDENSLDDVHEHWHQNSSSSNNNNDYNFGDRTTERSTTTPVTLKSTLYNKENPFEVRIVGIFVADSELPYTLELAKPSTDIAVERAKELFPLVKWEDAIFRNGSNRCNTNYAGVIAAEEFHQRRVTAFIGLSCGLALDPVARMAAHWRIPVISSGGPHVQFSDKRIFSTLTRLSFSLTNLGSFVRSIFYLFKWRHVSIIVHEKPSSPLIPLVKETIVDAFDREPEIMMELHEISRSLVKTNIRNLLIDCAKEARVIFIITRGELLRQILLAAFDLKMNNGGYVFIAVELFKHVSSFGNFDWFVPGDPRNDDVKQIYQSLFLISVHVPITDLYQQFAEDVIVRSRTDFNTSFTVKDVNVILAGFYDSVLMYGKAISDTIADGEDPADGYQVTKRIWNRTFVSGLNGDIYINANGDKETDYTLKDFNPDSLEMQSVINFSGRQNQIIWKNLSAISWPNRWAPPSNPALCHSFIVDLNCNKKSRTMPYWDALLVLGGMLLVVLILSFFVYRRFRLESELTSLWWKIRANEIILIHNQTENRQVFSSYSNNLEQQDGQPTTAAAAPSTQQQQPITTTLSSMVDEQQQQQQQQLQQQLQQQQQLQEEEQPQQQYVPTTPKSCSAPESVSHKFRVQLKNDANNNSLPETGDDGTAAAGGSGAQKFCIVEQQQDREPAASKKTMQTRVNDYFALPTYISAHCRGNRGIGIFFTNLRNTNSRNSDPGNSGNRPDSVVDSIKCQSSSSSPTKLMLAVRSSSQNANTSTSNNLSNLTANFEMITNRGRKQVSSESLAQIPNKGIYKGSKVFIKHLALKHFTVSRELLVELKQLKDMAHENLIRFVGICQEQENISILTEYCEKGNLRDLLDNEGIRIDWPFRYSLISDIVEGMLFIHESSLSFHGALKSSNCVIDSRLVVKLTDFGLKSIRNLSKQNMGAVNFKSLLWTAPEHLRQRKPEMNGSQKGDVYSFSIVLQEIITRSGPFETVKVIGGDGKFSVVSLDPQFIIQQLKLGGSTPYRPNVDENDCLPELNELLLQCWDEEATNRPSFSIIRSQIRKIAKEYVGGSGNSFLENLLLRLEQYANDLEILVEQKTSAFFEEKRKCEDLLYELLPQTVADQLKKGNSVKPESYKCVTIFFSDIVQFTQIAADSTPIEIVNFLNDLYTLFDSIISNYDVYKVETVGDAYMVVSGLPIRNGNEHARQIARMSLELLHRLKQFRIVHLPEREVRMRIGVHSGPCAAGVIGLKMPRYCLFGDTVNTASRMESHGEPNKIHISATTKYILDKFGMFQISVRGDIYLKGKGIVRTYWLDKEKCQLIGRHRFPREQLQAEIDLEYQSLMEANDKAEQRLDNLIADTSNMLPTTSTASMMEILEAEAIYQSELDQISIVTENSLAEFSDQLERISNQSDIIISHDNSVAE